MLPGRSDCHNPNHADHADDCLSVREKILLGLWTDEDRFRPIPATSVAHPLWVPPTLENLIARRGHPDVKLRSQWPA